jgi:predicted phosphodiesterase
MIGLLSDAHGNPEGLRACIAALRARGCTQLFFLGDAVGYLPRGSEVLDLLESERVPCQMGNHEAMMLGLLPLDAERDAVYGLAAQRARLEEATLARIAHWPRRRSECLGGRRLLLLHGGPADELAQYVYPDSDLDGFDRLDADVVAVGHSHHAFVRRVGNTTVIGAGSCGLPRDVGDLAACAVYDPVADAADIIRIPFDARRVLDEATANGSVHASVARVLARRREPPVAAQPQGDRFDE